jgi:Alpha/beta hydrolase family
MQEEQMRYADAGSVRIAYDDEGPRADDAVVFLGGWCNGGRSFFAPLAERLAARHRVIRLDWRGHGDSGRPAADFGHDELADDAMAVIQATGVRRVVPVSQAHGGWPALRARTCAPGGRGRWWSALLDAMPGASEQTRRVKIVNANWVPGTAGRQEQFEVMIITEDDQRHVVPATAASVTAVVALARAGTVMAWDPEGGGMLIAANVVGEMPWTTRE